MQITGNRDTMLQPIFQGIFSLKLFSFFEYAWSITLVFLKIQRKIHPDSDICIFMITKYAEK